MKRLITLCICLAFLPACKKEAPGNLAAGTTTAPAPITTSDREYRIAMIPKESSHVHWKRMQAGAMKAALDLTDFGDIEIILRAPEREDDHQQQIALIEEMIESSVDAILLAPQDRDAMVPSVQRATQAGIPVIILDSGINAEAGTDFATFIASDNYSGGQLGGNFIASQLPDGGKVLLLRYLKGSESTEQREKGFMDTLSASGKYELVDSVHYAGPTRGTAVETALQLLTRNSDYDAIYAPNESSTHGILLVLQKLDLIDNVILAGFDSSPGLLHAMRKGDIKALSVQNPMKMGYMGVKAAMDAIDGKQLQPCIDTGILLITKDNVDNPDNADIVSPDYEKYLLD